MNNIIEMFQQIAIGFAQLRCKYLLVTNLKLEEIAYLKLMKVNNFRKTIQFSVNQRTKEYNKFSSPSHPVIIQFS